MHHEKRQKFLGYRANDWDARKYRRIVAEPASGPGYCPICFCSTMRAELIGHFKACMTDIYLHIYARMANYIRTHPYINRG